MQNNLMGCFESRCLRKFVIASRVNCVSEMTYYDIESPHSCAL